jgi:hypothetical protein
MFNPLKRFFLLPTVRCYQQESKPFDTFVSDRFSSKMSALEMQEFVSWKTKDITVKNKNLTFLKNLVADPVSYRYITHYQYHLHDSEIDQWWIIPVSLWLASVSGAIINCAMHLYSDASFLFPILVVPPSATLCVIMLCSAFQCLWTRLSVFQYKYKFNRNVKNNLSLLRLELQRYYE